MRRYLVFPALLLALFQASCGETAATGEKVAIPRIFVDCRSAKCKTNRSPAITVIFTTSGCGTPSQMDFGATISGSTLLINCNTSTGCYGEITSWIDKDGLATNTVPSGTYSLCGRVDFDRDYPEMTDDAIGTLDNVAVGTTTSNQFITSWSDL